MLQKTSKFSPYNSRQNYNKCNHIPDEDEVSFDSAIVNHKTTVKIQSTNSGKTPSDEHPHRCSRALPLCLHPLRKCSCLSQQGPNFS